MKKRIIAILTCLVIIISAVYFAPDSDAGVSTLNITNMSKTITTGKSFQIKLNGLKTNKVKWSSSKPSVATVTKKGVVNGISAGKTVITGKYKGIKFKINVKVNNKNSGDYSRNGLVLKYKGAKVTKRYGDKCVCISYTFTNNNPKAVYFAESFSYTAFVNGIEQYATDTFGDVTAIKNGASIDVDLYYEVKSGDKLEFEIADTNNYKVFFKKTLTVE